MKKELEYIPTVDLTADLLDNIHEIITRAIAWGALIGAVEHGMNEPDTAETCTALKGILDNALAWTREQVDKSD